MLPDHCSILTSSQKVALERILTEGIRLYVSFINVCVALLCVDALRYHVM